jgi:hypothetical protein
MKRFVAGADRAQSTLLPESLDDWVDESNPVRVIDAFVDALNVGELGFEGVKPAATGEICQNCCARDRGDRDKALTGAGLQTPLPFLI